MGRCCDQVKFGRSPEPADVNAIPQEGGRMAGIADYIVLRDSPIEIIEGDSWSSDNVPVPDDLATGGQLSQAILQYKARPPQRDPFAPFARLRVEVNGHFLEQVSIHLDTVRGLWEIFPSTILNAGTNVNFAQIHVESGRVLVSDVILWFRRAV